MLSAMTPNCIYCLKDIPLSDLRPNSVVSFGFFTRKSDQKRLQRFHCRTCRRTFSEASLSPCYYQKKRTLNGALFKLLVSGVSQRRSAMILQVNRKTVVRKFLFLGIYSHKLLLETNKASTKAHTIQFDDLETFEHSKCKPLSVTMAVEETTRRILCFRVAQMPAKGLLTKIAQKKYGSRKDKRPQARKELFTELKELVTERVYLKSDRNPSLPF